MTDQKPTPHPKQQEAIDKIRSIRGPAWLRGDMGVGKTLISLWSLLGDFPDGKFEGLGLIICPEKGVMEHWGNELTKLGQEFYLLKDAKDVPGFYEARERGVKWFVVQYNAPSLRRKTKFKRKVCKKTGKSKLIPNPERTGDALWSMFGEITHMLVDETQKWKDPNTRRVKHWKKFVRGNYKKVIANGVKERRILLLSGTPLVKCDMDLISQYQVCGIEHEIAPLIKYETKEFQWGSKSFPVGWLSDEELDSLGLNVAEVLGRRRVVVLRKDVFPSDLPEPINHKVFIDLGSDSRVLDMLLDEACEENDSDELRGLWDSVFSMAMERDIHDDKDAHRDYWDILHLIAGRLRIEREFKPSFTVEMMPMYLWNVYKRAEGRLMAEGVAEAVKDWANRGEQVVVFANNLAPLHIIKGRINGAGPVEFYTGEHPHAKNMEAKGRFKEGDSRIMLSNFTKGGVGIEFTPAKVCVLAQRSPSPADIEQAKARIYRMNTTGQTHMVTCMAKMAEGTTKLEKSLSRIIKSKKDAAAKAGLEGSLG